jgi:hypothetical protein
MTDEIKEFDGNGHEVLGQIRVLKIAHDEGADRPYHLELDLDAGLTDALVHYGSEVFGNIDLLSAGIRGALIEGLAREKGM